MMPESGIVLFYGILFIVFVLALVLLVPGEW